MAESPPRAPTAGRWARRARFAAASLGRTAWYGAHRYATRRIDRHIGTEFPDRKPIARPEGPIPDKRRMLRDIARLHTADLANVEAGIYPMPAGEGEGLAGLIRRIRLFYSDVPDAARRRRVADMKTDAAQADALQADGSPAEPPYYLQDFHFQADGWMSDESASLYDFQVEVLFSGSAAAMRRQGLVPLARLMREKDQRQLVYADIACGTGAMLREVNCAFPRLNTLGFDVSAPYLKRSRALTPATRHRRFAAALAESLPLADNSLDAASIVYLFHELPPQARRAVAGETARVLKPGGILVLIDTLQRGDEPDYDGLLEIFPKLFHEPYYESYVGDDLDAIFTPHGLIRDEGWNAYVSRVNVFRKE